MDRIERMLAWCLVGLGALQCGASPLLFKQLEEPAMWFFAGGILLGLVGVLSLLRLRYGTIVPALATVSIASNIIVACLWIALAWVLTYKFNRYPAAYAALALIVLAAACSLRSIAWVRRALAPTSFLGRR